MFRKTYLQSDHRLVVSKVRLKLKDKRRIAQRELRVVTDMNRLGEDEVEDFRRLFAENLSAASTDGVDEV